MRPSQCPTRRDEQRSGDSREIYSHPAYGLVGITVVTGGDPHLFGSDIKHNQRVCLHIKTAEHHRNLSNDWYHDRNELIEVEMSHSQFAEMITSPNHGGVPCTITRLGFETVPSIEQVETKHDMFRREIEATAKQRLKDALTEVKKLGALIESGKTPKGELRELHKNLERELSYLPGTIGFVVDQAEEALEKATTDAKIDIEATINSHISRLGLDAARAIGIAPPSTITVKKEIDQ